MVRPGQMAPKLEVTLSDGSKQQLSYLWKTEKLVLVFLRHLGWVFCREQVTQLRQYKHNFDTAGAQVVLVAMATPEQVRDFRNKFELPFVMLSDPLRNLHQTFKIDFMSLASTFSPVMVMKFVTTIAKGHGIGVPYGDIRQLPAVFIIKSDGIVAYSHYGKDAADHPHPKKIIQLLNHC